jgi:hypothetical protein
MLRLKWARPRSRKLQTTRALPAAEGGVGGCFTPTWSVASEEPHTLRLLLGPAQQHQVNVFLFSFLFSVNFYNLNIFENWNLSKSEYLNFKIEHFWFDKFIKFFAFFNLNNFQIWTNLSLNNFILNIFLIWTICKFKQFSNLNNFLIWTFFKFEQFSNLNNFLFWTNFYLKKIESEEFSNFRIWTFFKFEYFLNHNNFRIWRRKRNKKTDRKNKQKKKEPNSRKC